MQVVLLLLLPSLLCCQTLMPHSHSRMHSIGKGSHSSSSSTAQHAWTAQSPSPMLSQAGDRSTSSSSQ